MAKGIHIGLIPDGNRRYAKQKGLPVAVGHWEGKKKISEFLDWCLEYPEIKTVTIYGLSTENLHRSDEEVENLWDLYTQTINEFARDPKVKEKQIRIRVLGDKNMWHPDLNEAVKHAINSTKQYSKILLNVLRIVGEKLTFINSKQE